MQYQDIAVLADKIRENIGKVIIGKEDKIDLILSCLLAGGHILLEDMPGTGKTVMAKTLAKSLNCDFSRIQFTPDLLPTDITGTSVYKQQKGVFEFIEGPVFANILLADEINRATPRTQAALLECMEERQVTESGEARKLSTPFIVIATQNPVETQGTFPLPEAQLDRFLIRLDLGYPTDNEAIDIMKRFVQDNPLEGIEAVAKGEDIVEAHQLIRTCSVSDAVMKYIADLCKATHTQELALGVSPRGMLALLRLAQAYACVHGRDYVIPDDVKALAVPALAHRIILKSLYGKSSDQEAFIKDLLNKVTVPTEEIQ